MNNKHESLFGMAKKKKKFKQAYLYNDYELGGINLLTVKFMNRSLKHLPN